MTHTAMMRSGARRGGTLAAALALTLGLAACASEDPLGTGTESDADGDGGTSETIVIGSQQYYSNEIIAELYAQALEDGGFTVDRQFQIGQRDVYIPELEAGRIDLLPEYSGNLLQHFDGDSSATSPAEIEAALGEVLPAGLRVLSAAEASDQDSYTTTAAFAEEWDLVSLGDLAEVTEPLSVAANAEFEERPYGPAGLLELYGVVVTVTPVQDSGGPLTLRALTDATVQLANIYTADPAIQIDDLVVLEDPLNLILPQNVIPLVSDRVDAEAAAIIDEVNAALTSEQLVALNVRSTVDQESSATIARSWLAEQGIVP